MSGRLQGKVAIVTGAGCVGPGWGNGRAMAVRFAEEGARVLAADRDPARLAETLERAARFGGDVMHAHQCDATDSASVEAMVAACIKQIGRAHV